LIPSSRLYQIGSPLTFSSCHGCTFQVDGTLNVSEVDVNKWLSQPAIFQLAGASNVTISGSGLINGKNWTSQYGNPTTMFNLDSASDIRVSGLTIKSPRATFFNIRNSRDLKFSSLSLSTNVDSNSASKYSSWVFGFQIEDSFNVDISPQTSITGVSECVRIGYNVNSTSVFGLNCAGGDAGVYINVAGAHNGETLPFSNLSFTNLTIEDAYQATGIKAWGGTFTAENITWQNVSVHGVMVPAYVTGCGGSGC
jgi:galacturan 1,4-alpha-galacturonidase